MAKRLAPSELLRRAKARIEDPAHWCQRAYHFGKTRHCAVGATRMEEFETWNSLLDYLKAGVTPEAIALAKITGAEAVLITNDRLGHAAVMAMYDRAIALAEEDEAHG